MSELTCKKCGSKKVQPRFEGIYTGNGLDPLVTSARCMDCGSREIDERKGAWIQTFTGLQFWPLDPRADEVSIVDIAHSLALQCRFGGHCRWHYSVGDHSLRVSAFAESMAFHDFEERRKRDPEIAKLPSSMIDQAVAMVAIIGLMHDSDEAYLVDMPRPIKRHLPEYKKLALPIFRVIGEHFRLPTLGDEHMDSFVKLGDEVLLVTEKRDLMGPPPAPWTDDQGREAKPLPTRIFPSKGQDEIEWAFIQRFDDLWRRLGREPRRTESASLMLPSEARRHPR